MAIDAPSKELVRYDPAQSHDALVLPDADAVRRELQTVALFQQLVKATLVDGRDYGVIPGTGNKPTLFKAGAEKVTKLLHLRDEYDFVDKAEDWTGNGFFAYTIRCRLINWNSGIEITQGLGHCNSREVKYRYRWEYDNKVPEAERIGRKKRTFRAKSGKWITQYRFDNEEAADGVNTYVKMAKKRGLVDAALSVGRLSEIFTQDLEDRPSATRDADAIDGEFTEHDGDDEPGAPPDDAMPQSTGARQQAPRSASQRVSEDVSTAALIESTDHPLWKSWARLVGIAQREKVNVPNLKAPTPRSRIPETALKSALESLRGKLMPLVGDEAAEQSAESEAPSEQQGDLLIQTETDSNGGPDENRTGFNKVQDVEGYHDS